jgi:Tol biopolymer transport system component/DNA-binding winged helix-turn-helix (wHTH) protein
MDSIGFEDFDLDARNYRLRRSGQDVRLERIPLELLLLLADRAGEVVTREEIAERLWGKGVQLDTENAINTAIRKIRLALGDDPAQPRFVQTVTGKGYRFIARRADTTTPAAAVPEGHDNRASSAPAHSVEGRVAGSNPVARLRRAAVFTGSAACLLAVGIVSMRWNPSLPQVSNYAQITNDGQPKVGPLLTDGLRLYFTEGSQNHRALVQVAASGGETTVLANPLETPHLMDIAPNRSDLLIGSVTPSNPGLWILPLPASGVRRMGDLDADDATWFPDGGEIAYISGNVLYRAAKDGTGPRKLAGFEGIPSWPRWSPDGSRLRVTVTNSITGFSSLWEVSADGKRPHPILAGWDRAPSECCGSWTPDGSYFLFQATRDGKTEIWAIHERRGLAITSSQPVRLTAGQMNSLAPAVSLNGKKLYVIGEQLRGELVHYDARSREFVPYLSGISAEFVDLSRDRRWVTYVSFPDRILWRSRIDGTERLQLTAPPVQATMPRWSPDARRIAYFDAAPGKPWRIYLISADGGKPEPLLNEPRNQMDPNWSPDGNSVIFSYFPIFERAPPEKLGIYMVDLKTRKVKKLPGSDGLWVPRWSPDGSHIVARSADSRSLLLFDFATQAWSELTTEAYVVPANWSTDGRSVFYVRRGAQPAVLRVTIANRKVEEIVSLKDLRQTGFRGAIWTGLTSDDSPLFLRDIGTQEIYALDLQVR